MNKDKLFTTFLQLALNYKRKSNFVKLQQRPLQLNEVEKHRNIFHAV